MTMRTALKVRREHAGDYVIISSDMKRGASQCKALLVKRRTFKSASSFLSFCQDCSCSIQNKVKTFSSTTRKSKGKGITMIKFKRYKAQWSNGSDFSNITKMKKCFVSIFGWSINSSIHTHPFNLFLLDMSLILKLRKVIRLYWYIWLCIISVAMKINTVFAN